MTPTTGTRMGRLSVIATAGIALLAACSTKPPARPPPDAASLGGALSSRNGVTTRRIWAGPDVEFDGASPSPEGKRFAFSEANTGNLVVRDLVTGQNRTLTRDSTGSGRQWVFETAFAPDGRHIAFTYRDSISQLRVIDSDGGQSRVLVADSSRQYQGPPTWSPSGRDIAVVASRNKTSEIALVSVATGAWRTLKTFSQRQGAYRLAWSPDGRFLAYDLPRDQGNHQRDVHLLAIDGRRETRVTDDEAWDEIIGWSPAGDQLLFYSDRQGTEGVWAIPIADGIASGAPAMVRRDLWNAQPMGLSRGGLFYGVTIESRANYVATLDLERAQVAVAPVRYSTRVVPNRIPDWSPDGRSIAFGVSTDHTAKVGIRNLESNEVREIETPLDFSPLDVRWSPEGTSLLAAASEGGRGGVYRIDLLTGRTALLVAAGGNGAAAGTGPEPSRDGMTLFLGRFMPKEGVRALVARDLATGVERELTRVAGTFGALSLSPDGRELALISIRRAPDDPRHPLRFAIRVVPTAGGEGRLIYEPTTPAEVVSTFGGLAWSKDGRQLLFVRISADHSTDELMVISAAGGEPRKLFAAAQIWGVRLNADGRRILFNSGSFKGEVWVMENLPSARPAGAAR